MAANNLLFTIKHIQINVINNSTTSIVIFAGTNINSLPIEYNAVPTNLNAQNIKANIAISQLEKFFICIPPNFNLNLTLLYHIFSFFALFRAIFTKKKKPLASFFLPKFEKELLFPKLPARTELNFGKENFI